MCIATTNIELRNVCRFETALQAIASTDSESAHTRLRVRAEVLLTLQRWGTVPVENAEHVQDESTGGDNRIRESNPPTSTSTV